ncbi:KpsF/GutQ family protein [Salinisphaera orenii MK-B5]|uniref:Arabinose 5-phosphate isomerase n=2 Tax=Salinisphaera orenii TaxID=856731 RepID=A0A423PHJ3_9GAMM|nr:MULTISPECIES: KpsF/GutQ family sugar-phosphate isomerase [Salinisphaera]ROO25013.1 KpsF/GutQ family protein [Salinisphaera orenii MK-B5]ROO37681.1 D-arabinose 5-phosphate isomerase [Salinisphaera halophila YIM 95161]
MDRRELIGAARRVIDIEATAVAALESRIDTAFAAAAQHMLECRGRVVVTGMGKSGHIAGKIAATLASTGTPAFFVHPGEASHGDLGMITAQDTVLALSYSGETAEILTILPLLKRLAVPLIAMTGNARSTLGRRSDVHLDVSVAIEACPLELAPTASTTAALAMGDALAIALLEARHFTAEDFARSHPGGTLGRRLLLTVADLMHTGDALPLVDDDALVGEALLEMTAKGLGMTGVTDAAGRLTGLFTDGDLRRTLDRDIDIKRAPIADCMTRDPKTVTADTLAAEAVRLLQTHRIGGGALMVVDDDERPIGALNMQDLLRAGVI